MLELILAAALLGPPDFPQDTAFAVREGDRLVLRDFTGDVEVEGWDRSELWAEAEDDDDVVFRLTRSGSEIELSVLDRRNRNRVEELRLALPVWMDLEVRGPKLDVEIRGMRSEVSVRNLKGDILLRDLAGRVDASTVEGSIDAVGLRGTARLETGDDDIRVIDSGASLELESLSGNVELIQTTGTAIRARTTEGDVDFTGTLSPGGDYAFRSHGGDLTLTLEPPVDAEVSVLVYEGEFESDFPIRTRGFRSGHEFEFVLGNGGVRLLLEAFDGEVTLLRGDG